MTKLLPSDLAKKLAISFPPLSVEPVFEGYRLVCDRQRQQAIAKGEVTYDLARMMEPPVQPLKCSEFAQAIISHFND